MVCSILSLDPREVFFGKVEGYDGARVVARVTLIEGDSLSTLDEPSPIIDEIETRLRRTGVPMGMGLGVFKIDPVNVKILEFQEGVLQVMITDLGASIPISMAGYY